jgi:proteasome lid subunit RPN8/RPN11
MATEFRLPLMNRTAIYEHALQEYPLECVGLIAVAVDNPRLVVTYRLTNVQPRSELAFEVDPEEQFKAYVRAQDANREVIGVYHSHTHSGADPSLQDIRHAQPGQIHVIAAVDQARVVEFGAFTLAANRAVERLELTL